MEISESVFQYCRWAIDAAIVLASLVFFYSFCKVPQKNYGQYLIFILCVIDLLNSLDVFIFMGITQDSTYANALGAFNMAMFDFCLFWSTVIAIFVYKIIVPNKPFNLKKFVFSAFFYCLGAAVVIGVLIYINLFGAQGVYSALSLYTVDIPMSGVGNQVGYFLIFDVLGKLVPIAITFYCYLNVYKALKSSADSNNPSKVLWYSFIQMICFLPYIVNDLYSIYCGSQDIKTGGLKPLPIYILHHLWGFFNLMAYWFLSPDNEGKKIQSIDPQQNNELSATIVSNSYR